MNGLNYMTDVGSLVTHVQKVSPVPLPRSWWTKCAWEHLQVIEDAIRKGEIDDVKIDKMTWLTAYMNDEIELVRKHLLPVYNKHIADGHIYTFRRLPGDTKII